jgi:RNA polymerase sigma-70 factor, ECF subfamily
VTGSCLSLVSCALCADNLPLNDADLGFLDEQLAKARMGEPTAFAALVRAHQRIVYSLALRMLGTRDLAEDLAQDVFMQLNTHVRFIESAKHLLFWLRQVTANRAIDQLRKRSRIEMTSLEEDSLKEEEQIFSTVDGGDPLLERHLRVLISDLSPPARAVLLLRYQEDLDPIDIARTLDMPINTVKSHLRRSLDVLRQRTPGAEHSRCEDNSHEQ